ncbi:uncharacterized protein LOC106639090 [Copidosoma floridanum]|uniref:uncharacterized protein LOC106639090 n=1 Tax=Copidosoma floridanum TaxID=29053 RepID=UPI000C6FAEDA|nr:uncharacterized protein LOC106639090 [Copidosoma floridanum]
MAAPRRSKKRVRIQSSNETKPHYRSTKKRSKPQSKKKSILKSKIGGKIGCQPRRLTVSELVYYYLEKASRSEVEKRRKGNAASRFRRNQRRNRSKRLKPARRMTMNPSCLDHRKKVYLDGLNTIFMYEICVCPFHFNNKCFFFFFFFSSAEKCIYDLLLFGSVMGFLEPVDKKGIVFRVTSDLNLFDRETSKNEEIGEPYDFEDNGTTYYT